MSTEIALFAPLGILAAAALACGWALICNNRTFRDVTALADVAFSSHDWRELASDLESVDYDRHCAALFFGRDPFKLYPPRLVERFRQITAQDRTPSAGETR